MENPHFREHPYDLQYTVPSLFLHLILSWTANPQSNPIISALYTHNSGRFSNFPCQPLNESDPWLDGIGGSYYSLSPKRNHLKATKTSTDSPRLLRGLQHSSGAAHAVGQLGEHQPLVPQLHDAALRDEAHAAAALRGGREGDLVDPPERGHTVLAAWWLGHPSEKYESQLGWGHSQYMGK